MEYEKLKAEVQEIAAIAASVPEQFQQRCFELLLTSLLNVGERPQKNQGKEDTASEDKFNTSKPDEEKESSNSTSLPLNAATRAWMQRTGVTKEELAAVLFVEEGEVHFVREPDTQKNATAQREWALLLSLRNALLGNAMAVDAETVRSMLQDKGYYDQTNFAKTFKNMAALFRQVLEPQGDAQALSNDGQQDLGKLIKALATKAAK